jgi:guanine deaminase
MRITAKRNEPEARPKLFLGSFVHSKALDELEYLHNAAVAVDEKGTIVAVERECDEVRARETVLPRLGWGEADVEVVKARDGQFFFPGFVGTSPRADLTHPLFSGATCTDY